MDAAVRLAAAAALAVSVLVALVDHAGALLAALATVTFVGWAFGDAGPVPFALVVLAEVLFSLAVLRPVRAILSGVEAPARDLALVAGVFARFEREAFHAPRLRALVEGFKTAGVPPSRRIAQLQRLIDLPWPLGN